MTEKLPFRLTNECEAFGAFTSFCRIWGSKGTGSLSFETSDGKMLIRLEQHLGPLHGLRPGPLGRQGGQEKHQDPVEGAHKNPRSSRQRRKEKRAAARDTAEKVENPENTANLTSDQENVTENVDNNQFKCDLCDFTTSAKNGVRVHKGHKHKDIENLLDDNHETSLDISSVSEIRDEVLAESDSNYIVATDQDESTEVIKLNKIIKENNASISKLMSLLETQLLKNEKQSKQLNEAGEKLAFFDDIATKMTKEIEQLKKS